MGGPGGNTGLVGEIGPYEDDARPRRGRQNGDAHVLAAVQADAGEDRRSGQGVLMQRRNEQEAARIKGFGRNP